MPVVWIEPGEISPSTRRGGGALKITGLEQAISPAPGALLP
ncbi:hypothetical protein [uncultured Microbacterium sp.]|nr:hypothetical protein [uncultured Microbacterium sp.]